MKFAMMGLQSEIIKLSPSSRLAMPDLLYQLSPKYFLLENFENDFEHPESLCSYHLYLFVYI